ncbi:MAG: ABC transporter ATP-binding protein [Sporomusaceae bacterium]|nr:ABC transporter ATP-binding protein [Sporomusaceae bacterium]
MGILLQNIKKCYKIGTEEVAALGGISLTIETGEFVAIMGPSGSGKSTLMNILGCLDRPSSGSYILEGQEVAQLDDDALAGMRNRQIGFVFQNFNLLSRVTALENVALPLVYARVPQPERRNRATALLEAVGLATRTQHLPNELSGGQRQRVAIARALVNEPSIIMADEPTGNLDSRSSIEIMNLFGNLHKQGKTVILVTHEPDIAEYAKRVITVKDGFILKDEVKESRYV